MIVVYRWSLLVDWVDSFSEYNSFQNFSVRLIVEEFKPTSEIPNPKFLKSGKSLFRDPETKTLIQNFRHWFAQKLIAKNPTNIDGLNSGPKASECFALPLLADVLQGHPFMA